MIKKQDPRHLEDGSLEDMRERQHEEWIRKFRPWDANRIIKTIKVQDKLNQRANKRCYICESYFEMLHPYWIDRCPGCVRKYVQKHGVQSTVIMNSNTNVRFFCTGCAKLRTGRAKLQVQVCLRDLNRLIAKNLGYPKEEQDVRDKIQRIFA